jgi:hypothetical protein
MISLEEATSKTARSFRLQAPASFLLQIKGDGVFRSIGWLQRLKRAACSLATCCAKLHGYASELENVRCNPIKED